MTSVPSRALADPRGITLIELIIAMGVFGLIMLGVLGTWTKSQEAYFVGSEVAEVQQNVRSAIDFLVRELRSTGRDATLCAFDFVNVSNDCDAPKRLACVAKTTATFPNGNSPGTGTGCQGVYAIPAATATATQIRIRSDRNSNGTIVGFGNADGTDGAEEDVTYALVAAGSCPSGIPGACITRDDGSGPVAMVAVDITGFTLTYFPRAGFAPCNGSPIQNPCPPFTTFPLTQDQADNIAQIRIDITALQTSAGQTVRRTLQTDVVLKNRR
jgi:prepilin-type N-terminal cleavage/methylation domain-containing protein